MWKSDSVRLGLRIFTTKGNEKNLESTTIGTTVRTRSVLTSATVYLTSKKAVPISHFMAYGTAPLLCLQDTVLTHTILDQTATGLAFVPILGSIMPGERFIRLQPSSNLPLKAG
ncbi:hypothetical protein [Paenibacillus sp. sgz5001063]|uniref:hypothetical protein n=1 Tax=Paenibacillus sp. sgz5001063 TaxID=3242474 RepID=UPI0036D23D37